MTATGMIPGAYPLLDEQVAAMIPAASQMVATYTERDFGAPLITDTRTYEYDGSGFLDIDDCVNVNDVSLLLPGYSDSLPLDPIQWMAGPTRRDDAPVYYYIRMPGYMGGISGEMGFIRNLDVAMREGRALAAPLMAMVTAQWGWPEIPVDVKQATVWIIQDWMARTEGEGLTSESIESYSRSWQRSSVTEVYAIPARARDVLAAYAKIQV